MDNMKKPDQDFQRDRKIIARVIPWVTDEVVYLFVGIWNVLRRFIIILVAIGIIIKIVSLVMLPTVCQSSMLRVLMGRYCSSDSAYNGNAASNKLVPIGFLFEKSRSLAEVLANSGVPVSSRMIESQLGITELIITLRYSKIDSLVKADLLTHFTTLEQSTQKAADELYGLVAVYDTVLDYLHTFAENASIFSTQEFSSSNSLIDDGQNLTERSSNGGISLIGKKFEPLLTKAQNTHCQLQGIVGQLVLIRDLLEINRVDTEYQLDQLESENFLAKLYRLTLGNRRTNQIKHERNWNTLHGLIDFVRSGMANTQNILIKLKKFQNDAVQVEKTVSEMTLQPILLDTHMELLAKAVNRLDASKEAFHGKRRLTEGSEL